ncbi:MAG: T9SS type A sorting domain-containing protein [Opitutaceae bacterium]|nr:T9SS type A sorting domain-containing protein [Cytophagales bacterium]
MKKFIASIGLIALACSAHSQDRINITSSMVTDEKMYPYSSPNRMFDEQASIVSETLTSKPGTWWGDYMESAKYYPLSAVVDLGTETDLTNIYVFDNNGMSNLKFYYKNTAGWQLMFTDPLSNYQTWNKHTVNLKSRYIRIVSEGIGGNFGEVVMFKAKPVIVPLPPVVVLPPVQQPTVTSPIVPALPMPNGTEVKLSITGDMITDEKAFPESSPFKMFDEQANITAQPPVTQPSTSWGSYINKDLFYPLSSVINLGQSINISNIYVYDGGGSSNLSFYAKVNGTWELLFTDALTSWNTWNKHVVNKYTQFVKIVSDAPTGSFGEVVIYGDRNTASPSKAIAGAKTYPVLEDFLGVNILHTNSISDASIVKNIREFHLWTWNEANSDIANYPGYPANKYGFNPSPGNYWNFDNVYSSYKNKGMKIVPTLQGTAFWFNKALDGSMQDNKPVVDGLNTEDPASYVAHADYLYQFAARYGAKQVPTASLKLQQNNSPVSALNSIEGVENWNEPNKTWKSRKGMFSPYEYAAMTSADYDGHQGKLGTTVGVKNADPNLPFIMAGLTGMDTVYTKAMLTWFKNNRTDGVTPFNVINYHHYSNDAGGQVGAPSFGVSPEADMLEKKVKGAVDFNSRYLPGKPVWITEFGFDASQNSPQKAKAYGNFTGEDVQAMWLVRSSLAIYAGGADKAYLFWLQDDDSRNDYLFGTCGLTSFVYPGTPQKRKAYYWLSTLNKVAGKYRLTQKTVTGTTHLAQFEKPITSDTTVYCIWNGTSNGTITTGYKLNVRGSKAEIITPQVGSLVGKSTPATVVNGTVTINVTEDPIYVKAYGAVSNQRTEKIEDVEKSISNITVYPNPGNEMTNIITPEGQIIKSVSILDNNGNIVKPIINLFGNRASFNAESLANGIYNIQVSLQGSDNLIVNKFVVSK